MTENIKISDLQLDDHNANKGSERGTYMIRRSLEKLGAGRSILVDKNGRIIAGNKTAESAGDVGIEDVILVRTRGNQLVAVMREDLDLDDPTGEARQLAYADNRAGEVSLTWDVDALQVDIDAGVDLSDWFQPLELDDLLPVKAGSSTDAPAQVDRAEELREKWGVEAGQLWRLPSRTAGKEHRVVCGDSTRADVVDRVLNGERVDLVFTDPPYGVNVTGAGGNAIAGDISFTAIPLMFARLPDILADGAWVYICGGQSNMSLYSRLFEEYFRQLPRVIVWDKVRMVMRRNGYHSVYEFIYYCFAEGGGSRWYSERSGEATFDIWRVAPPTNDERVHLTEKPVELATRAINNTCPRGGVVWEPFLGSASTLIAAENLGRVCRGVEISPGYVAVALERYATAFGIEPELVE